jgi:hypothetical protein
MTVTINLPPDKEAVFKAQARAHGLSVEEWLLELAELAAAQPASAARKFDNLSDLLVNSPFAGANLNLGRSQDGPRPIELE